MDLLFELARGHYLQLKFFHLLVVMLWGFSTVVAYQWYVRIAWLSWAANPDDSSRRQRRDWAFEQFDRGVVVEHVAFPLVLASGLLLMLAAGWSADSFWLGAKLAIVVLIFIPMEIADYWLSHFGGNKRNIRRRADPGRYEKILAIHWLFFRITAPLIAIFVPLVIYLAVVKPA